MMRTFRLDDRAQEALGFLVRTGYGGSVQDALVRVLVRAAAERGCRGVDVQAVLERPRCAYCGGLLPTGRWRFCARSCAQLDYAARRSGARPGTSPLRARGGRYATPAELPRSARPATPGGEALHLQLERSTPRGEALLGAVSFLLTRPEAANRNRFVSGLVVSAAVAAGWESGDLSGYSKPSPCAFCDRPIPETRGAQARYCHQLCVQAAYYERKVGRRTRSLRRGDQALCAGCGVEMPEGIHRMWCPKCSAARQREASRGRVRSRRVRRSAPIPAEIRTCPACGTVFETRATSPKVYCSRRCKDRVKDRRRRGAPP